MAKKTTLRSTVKQAVKTTQVEDGTPANSDKVASEVIDKVQTDPVLQNELNQEPWWQSGVGFFGTGGVLWAIGVLLTQLSEHGYNFQDYDQAVVIAALGSLLTAIGVLYRRYWPGLKPMFHWFNK